MQEAKVRDFMSGESRKLTGASVGIPARVMDFPLPEGKPRFPFFGGNPLSCALFAVFSAIFPPGERFFVESVRPFRDRLDDQTLTAQVSGFIGQEAIHGREHEALNAWFREQGYDIAVADRMIRFSLGLLERLPKTQQAACTALMEHFTAVLAEQWLTHQAFRDTTDPDMIRLWSWHALEELEHKSVVFDVHARVSQRPGLERLLAVPLIAGGVAPGILFSWAWITLNQEGALNLRAHWRGLKGLLGRDGFLVPVFRRVPDFLRAGFHPADDDTTALEQTWREQLFGQAGELNAHFRNREAVARALAS